jgi:hypothetical protein
MNIMKSVFVLVLTVTAASIAAQAQVQVFVPGNTNGGFGGPIDLLVPFVQAITVDKPATITVTYVDGLVIDAGGEEFGPNGKDYNCGRTYQLPLQETHGIAGGICLGLNALIGVFVPEWRAAHKGFSPIDGTKDLTQVGIMPDRLFLIGESKTFDVKQAGTLFLGINDCWVSDNSGFFNVEVTTP